MGIGTGDVDEMSTLDFREVVSTGIDVNGVAHCTGCALAFWRGVRVGDEIFVAPAQDPSLNHLFRVGFLDPILGDLCPSCTTLVDVASAWSGERWVSIGSTEIEARDPGTGERCDVDLSVLVRAWVLAGRAEVVTIAGRWFQVAVYAAETADAA